MPDRTAELRVPHPEPKGKGGEHSTSTDRITLTINGSSVSVERGTSVAAAIMITGDHCRTSVSGESRGPLCGMGICFECRAILNGVLHSRTCQMLCEQGMEVVSQ